MTKCTYCNQKAVSYGYIEHPEKEYYCMECLGKIGEIYKCTECEELTEENFLEEGKCNLCRYSEIKGNCSICKKERFILKTGICEDCCENIGKVHFQINNWENLSLCDICEQFVYYKNSHRTQLKSGKYINVCNWCNPRPMVYELGE